MHDRGATNSKLVSCGYVTVFQILYDSGKYMTVMFLVSTFAANHLTSGSSTASGPNTVKVLPEPDSP